MAYGPRGDHAADKGFAAGGEGGAGHDGFVRARGRRESSFLQVTSHFIFILLFEEDKNPIKFHQQHLPVRHETVSTSSMKS